MLFTDVAARVAEVRGRIDDAVARGGHGQRVTLIAVTKTHGPEAVEAEQEGYERYWDAPPAELNPVVRAFQDVTIRKWEEWLESRGKVQLGRRERAHARVGS